MRGGSKMKIIWTNILFGKWLGEEEGNGRGKGGPGWEGPGVGCPGGGVLGMSRREAFWLARDPPSIFKRVQVVNRNRFEFSKKITTEYHLLDRRWNVLFLIICQKGCFSSHENQTRVPIIAIQPNWQLSEVRTPIWHI